MERIVVIGGGTGSYTILQGLKKYDVSLTAIVSMTDSGGSTGILRDEFGFLPPGDVRRCLIALSQDTGMLRKLFEYRFDKGTGLNGHSFGNLFLTALREITGSDVTAIKEASKILDVKGKVLPVTTTNCQLGAILENDKTIIGEINIDVPKYNPELRIKKLFTIPEASAYAESIEEILLADKIVIGPGDLYTSVLSNIVVKGIKKAINESAAKKIYVCNIMTKYGETTKFKASDFISEIEKYLGTGVLDYVVLNNRKPDRTLIEAYKTENSIYVEPDYSGYSGKKPTVLMIDLLNSKNLARHDSEKLAKAVVEIR